MHLEEQLLGLHHPPRLHPEVVSIDIKGFLHPPTTKFIMGWDCSLLLFRHYLRDIAALIDDPHVRLAMAFHEHEVS
jgi:hypothetical protein